MRKPRKYKYISIRGMEGEERRRRRRRRSHYIN